MAEAEKPPVIASRPPAHEGAKAGQPSCGPSLSIAKFIVDAHQGTITAESKSGQGSTFTVTLPAAPPT